jgi:phosphoribosylaminoimidazole (AIR) synthetase
VLPPVFRWLQTICNLPQHELLRTFNCGIGMVVVVAPDKLERALQMLAEAGEEGVYHNLGFLRARASADEPQVVVNGDVK